MHELTITAVGEDRPGIVSTVTGALFELGCNLADCSMTRLSGQFAMILLVESPDGLSPEVLEAGLRAPGEELGLSLLVRTVPRQSAETAKQPFVISLYGADHAGIVHAVSERLAARNVNITNLISRIVGEGIYTMILEVELPPGLDPPSLRQDLKEVAADLKVDFSLRPADSAEL